MTNDPLNNSEIRALCAVKNQCVTYSQLSLYIVFLFIWGSASKNSINLEFTIEKSMYKWTTELKSVLFKGQLYKIKNNIEEIPPKQNNSL